MSIPVLQIVICFAFSTVNTLNKKTTRTSRILQYSGSIRVAVLMRLNRQVRNRTHGGMRGRGVLPLLLDLSQKNGSDQITQFFFFETTRPAAALITTTAAATPKSKV